MELFFIAQQSYCFVFISKDAAIEVSIHSRTTYQKLAGVSLVKVININTKAIQNSCLLVLKGFL